MTPEGATKYLVATDHLEDDRLKVLTVEDLFDVVVCTMPRITAILLLSIGSGASSRPESIRMRLMMPLRPSSTIHA